MITATAPLSLPPNDEGPRKLLRDVAVSSRLWLNAFAARRKHRNVENKRPLGAASSYINYIEIFMNPQKISQN